MKSKGHAEDTSEHPPSSQPPTDATDSGAPQAPPPWEELTSRWHAVIPAVRRRWPQLTYMETLRVSGDRNHLCRLLCEKYDVTLDEADDMVWRWHSGGPVTPCERAEPS